MADWVQFAQHVIAKIDAETEVVEHHIANGGCSNFEDYRYQVGKMHGLQHSKDIIRALLKNTTGEEDD